MINQDDEEETSNSVGATRYPCMPSLVAMQQMRNRLNLAYLGKKLMKWSAMATGRELRRISHEIHGVYDDYSDDSRNGYILLARARYFYPHLNSIVVENIPKVAQVTLTNSIKTVSGVRVTQYAISDTGSDAYAYLGIERGGQLIKEAKTVWNHLLKRMIMILELRTSFILVEQANRSATKRFNVLGKLIIPKINFTLKYILSELEEKEREENFRLKRFKQLKTRRRDEEVHVCRCCLSTFAAGEIMDGDMCTICKKNVRFKGKGDRRVPHIQCIKDGQLQLDRACHLDSQRIRLSHEKETATYLTYQKSLQKAEGIEDEEKEIVPIVETYEEYLEAQIKDKELSLLNNALHDNEAYTCNETQKTYMFSYILSALNSVNDEDGEIAPLKNSLNLRKILRMPANLPYPYEGIDYLPRLLRMPKDLIPPYIETCTKCVRPKNVKMPSDLGSYSIPCVECKSLLNANVQKSPCEMKNCEKCRSMVHMPLDLPILSCPNCSLNSHLTMPLDISIRISPCESVHKNCKNQSPVLSFPPHYSPYAVPQETLVCHSWMPNIKNLQRMPRNLTSGSAQSDSTNEPSNMSRCSCHPKTHSSYPENKALCKYIHQLCQPQRSDNFISMPLNLAYENQPKDIIPAQIETFTKFASQPQTHAQNIKMPSDLDSYSIPCVECKSLLNASIQKNNCETTNCEKCRATIHMPADVPILSCPNCSSKLNLTMPLDIPIESPHQIVNQPKNNSSLRKCTERCTKCAPQSQTRDKNIKMPSDLGLYSIPCVECKSLSNANVPKTPCEIKNCEKCRATIHMPSDVPILLCPNCTSKLKTIPLDVPINESPRQIENQPKNNNILPKCIEKCSKCALQSQTRDKNIKMPPDLASYSIPCAECKSVLNANLHKSPCEIKNCEKCRATIHMPSDVPILSCPDYSSKTHLTMPIDIPVHKSLCQNENQPKDNILATKRETCTKCALLSQTSNKSIKMPSDLTSYSIPCAECKSLLNVNLHKSPCEIKHCGKCRATIHMPSDVPILSCPDCSSKTHLTMPIDIPVDKSPCQYENQPKDNILPTKRGTCAKCPLLSQTSNKKDNILPTKRGTCAKCPLLSQTSNKNLKMPSDLASYSIPCTECKSLLNENLHKSPCEIKNCEKCRATIHMPSDVPILSCPDCLSKTHLTMPSGIPLDISPCKSVYKNCKNLSPVTSFLPKSTPHSSYLPYAVPRESLVCHSWTPNIRKLLRMPRNLSSGSAQNNSTIEPPNMSRCSCQPNTHSLYSENEALHKYIHRLCQPHCSDGFLRMPLNLAIENQPFPYSGSVYIARETSSCSPCIITSSDEEKLYHDCKIDVDHSCASTCSMCLKNSDYEKIVKVETKKKRRPDGKFREEKVVTEKYVVKTLIKPPDICSCSQSDEFEDVVLGIWSCDQHKKDEDQTNKQKTDEAKSDKTEKDEDRTNKQKTDEAKIYKIDNIIKDKNTEYKTDENIRDCPLEIEPKCLDCKNKKAVGNEYDQNEFNNNTDNKQYQVICRCNEEKNNEAQMKCECYNVAISENDDSENICTLRRLPDLVCCKNDGCLTQKLLRLLTPCHLVDQKVASEHNVTNPCHSIVIKSADNETIVCTRLNSKEPSISGVDTCTPRKEVDILPPGCKFFKPKDTSSGIASTSPISSLEQKIITKLSMKWNEDSSSAKASAQLNQESTITKIVKSYLDKNNHKSTSCTDLKIVRECIEKTEKLIKPYIAPDLCANKKHCSMKYCPFHTHSIAASSSKQERKSPDNQSQKSCSEQPELYLPVTPRNTEINLANTNDSQEKEIELEGEYLKIKEEIDRVIKLTSTKKTQSYYKTLGPEQSTKSCCPIPSRLGMPITPTPTIFIPKSSLASNIYPSKYNNDVKTKDIGTQMKTTICDREVNPCDTCSKTSSLSCNSTKSKTGHIHGHQNHTKGKYCAVCNKNSASLSSHSSKHKTENKQNKTENKHENRHHSHHHDDRKTKDKCIIKIKVKESKKTLSESDDFCIEGELEDGSNVVIIRRSKSNISKHTRPDDLQEAICKNCLAILRGDKQSRTPNCNKSHQQITKCKYCELLADYSVSGDPSVNVSSAGSGNHCCQTSNFSAKSSFVSSVSMPGEELCIKFSTSPSQSNKTRFTPCSITPSRAELKACEQASRIRGYASDCTIHKPLKSCGTPTPRPCKSVCIVCPRTSDACTSTKVINRYDVRSICDEPRSRRRSRCTPKASAARCISRPLQSPMKSDTAVNRRKRRTRPVRTRSFYESDCKYFKPPCCGCPF